MQGFRHRMDARSAANSRPVARPCEIWLRLRGYMRNLITTFELLVSGGRSRKVVRSSGITQGPVSTPRPACLLHTQPLEWPRVRFGHKVKRNLTDMRAFFAIAAAAALLVSFDAFAQPANRDANTQRYPLQQSSQPGCSGLRCKQLHRGTGQVPNSKIERLCKRERAAERRSGSMARKGHERWQERQCQHRFPRQHHRSLSAACRPH